MVRVGAAVACAALVALLAGCDTGSSHPSPVTGPTRLVGQGSSSTNTARRRRAPARPPRVAAGPRRARARSRRPPLPIRWPATGSGRTEQPGGKEERSRRASGKTSDAALLARIAVQPTARWLGSWQALDQLGPILAAAGQTGATALFVAYYIPNRDCGGSSAGGARDGNDYQNWIAALAGKLGTTARGGGAGTGRGADVGPGRLRGLVLRSALRPARRRDPALKARPAVSVYLDAGHPAWPSDPTVSVTPLLASGLAAADVSR